MKYLNVILFFVFLAVLSCEDASKDTSEEVKTETFLKYGNGKFTFDNYEPLSDKPITVYTHLPVEGATDLPVMFVLHGHSRSVISNCGYWTASARQYKFIVICPEFDETQFPGSAYYQNGMMYLNNQYTDSTTWTYNLIEEIFTFLKENDATSYDTYGIYGYSGGGQFVHRYALFTNPSRASLIISGASGWYTLPNYSESFPYGLNNSPFNENLLREKFMLPMIILVGENDNNPNDSSLRKTSQAMRQGSHRFERAKFFYDQAGEESRKIGVNLEWNLITVPNVGHAAVNVAPIAAEMFHNSLN